MKQNEGLGVSDKLSECWATKDFYVEINGQEVQAVDIVDFEVLFGGKEKKANLIILDNHGQTSTLDCSSANPKTGGLVEVGYTDCGGCDYSETFSIKTITQKVDKKDQKLVNIELEDTDTRNMKGSFVAKGYPDKKFTEVVEKHHKEIKNKSKLKVIGPETEQTINAVINAGQSYFDIFHNMTEEKGFKYITERSTNYLVHQSKLVGKNEESGEFFEYDTDPHKINRIIQYNIAGYNSDTLLEATNIDQTSDDSISVNSKEKRKKGIDGKLEAKRPESSKNNQTIAVGAKGADMVATRGRKQGVAPSLNFQEFNDLKNAQTMTMWVPGRAINRIGALVEVNLPRPKFYEHQEYDPVFSGNWEITHVRDKIINSYFVQEIFLKRGWKG